MLFKIKQNVISLFQNKTFVIEIICIILYNDLSKMLYA